MATSQIPMKRLNEPHEVASAAVFLCSDAASMITAHVLPVDGEGGGPGGTPPSGGAPGGGTGNAPAGS